jgi:transcriptional regulator with XRE-family HTH domain
MSVATFGEQLRELRERAGLSQEILAVKAGVTSATVRNIERGRVTPLRITRLALLKALDDTSASPVGAGASGG